MLWSKLLTPSFRCKFIVNSHTCLLSHIILASKSQDISVACHPLRGSLYCYGYLFYYNATVTTSNIPHLYNCKVSTASLILFRNCTCQISSQLLWSWPIGCKISCVKSFLRNVFFFWLCEFIGCGFQDIYPVRHKKLWRDTLSFVWNEGKSENIFSAQEQCYRKSLWESELHLNVHIEISVKTEETWIGCITVSCT